MRLLIGAFGTIAALYLVVLVALYLLQRPLVFPAPPTIAALPPRFEQVELRTADSLTLKAAYRPATGDKPTVVFFHGNGDSWDGASAATALFARGGYGVLLPEYRGYGGNPGKPDEAGLYADGRAALAFLRRRGVADGQVVLIGNSLGSGVATELATEMRPRALVLLSAYTSLTDLGAQKFRWAPVRLLMRDRFDNLAKLGKVAAPVLVLHGEADTLIPVAHGRQIAEAAPNGAFIAFPHAGHELAYTDEAQLVIREWLVRQAP